MFSIQISKLFFLFTIVFLFTSCTNNLKQNEIKSKFDSSSNSGRFLSSRYLFNVGDTDFASKVISKSNNLHLDLTLAKLNFNSYLINGNFDKAMEFKSVAPSRLDQLPMYNLPEFVINLKKKKFLDLNNLTFMQKHLPGFKMILDKINYIKLVENETYRNNLGLLKKSDVFNLLIFENTDLEKQIYLNMQKENLSLIENILYLSYLKRKYPEKFYERVNIFSSKFDYDIKSLKFYFENGKNIQKKPDHKFIFANLFAYLSNVFSAKKNIPNSYLKILNEISHYLEPSLGISNYFLAEIYSEENNFEIAINKLNRIEKKSFIFLYSRIKKYKLLKFTDQNKSNLLLKSIQKKYPKNSDVLLLIANNYRDHNKCNQAIEIYDGLIERSTNKKNYYYLKAICLEKLNKWKEAKKILIKLVSKNPNDAYVLNYLSYSMAIRNENLIEAKKLITKAIRIEKNNGYFLDTLGWIHFKLNNIDKAIRTIQKAIELEPNNSEIIDHLGDIYYKMGRKKEAIYEWNKALTGNANDQLLKNINSKLKKYKR